MKNIEFAYSAEFDDRAEEALFLGGSHNDVSEKRKQVNGKDHLAYDLTEREIVGCGAHDTTYINDLKQLLYNLMGLRLLTRR